MAAIGVAMTDLFWLTMVQAGRIAQYFPLRHNMPRAEGQPVASGILHVATFIWVNDF
jgi:hypothetical protein